MRSATRVGLLILLVACVGTLWAQRGDQPGGPRRGGPRGEESSGEDGRPPRPGWGPRGEIGRYTITAQSGDSALLLDTATGDTWSFVLGDSSAKAGDASAKPHWEAISRLHHDHRPPREHDGPPGDGPRGERPSSDEAPPRDK